ncbi:unnamed protein product, partial [Dovyalis caffra]
AAADASIGLALYISLSLYAAIRQCRKEKSKLGRRALEGPTKARLGSLMDNALKGKSKFRSPIPKLRQFHPIESLILFQIKQSMQKGLFGVIDFNSHNGQ